MGFCPVRDEVVSDSLERDRRAKLDAATVLYLGGEIAPESTPLTHQNFPVIAAVYRPLPRLS